MFLVEWRVLPFTLRTKEAISTVCVCVCVLSNSGLRVRENLRLQIRILGALRRARC